MDNLVDDVCGVIREFLYDDGCYHDIYGVAFMLTCRRFLGLFKPILAHYKPHKYKIAHFDNEKLRRDVYNGIFSGRISDNFVRAVNNITGGGLTEAVYIGKNILEMAVDEYYSARYHYHVVERVCEIFDGEFKMHFDNFEVVCEKLMVARYSKSKFKRYLRKPFIFAIDGVGVSYIRSMIKKFARFKHELNALWREIP
ncbi:hypothetical protein F-VV10_0172 [Faustovirus]|nr:hypothetical protein F-VV10_0172 [Faustovirus]